MEKHKDALRLAACGWFGAAHELVGVNELLGYNVFNRLLQLCGFERPILRSPLLLGKHALGEDTICMDSFLHRHPEATKHERDQPALSI